MFAAAMLFGAGFTASAQQQGTSESGLYVPGALYVQFKDGTVNLPKSTDRHVPVSALFPAAKSQSKYGLQDKAFSLRMGSDAVLANTFCIYMDSLSGFDDFIKELQADSRIESIERVPMRRVQGRFAPGSGIVQGGFRPRRSFLRRGGRYQYFLAFGTDRVPRDLWQVCGEPGHPGRYCRQRRMGRASRSAIGFSQHV